MARSSGGRETSPDEALIRALYDQHGQAVLAFAIRRLDGDRAAGEDVFQETFMRAWRHPEVVVEGPDHVRGWLLKVARHIIIDRIRARDARPPEVPEDPLRPPVERDHAQSVVDIIAVLAGLGRLSPDHRAVLEERYIRDRSVRQAAETLGIPENTVKTRTASALAALRKTMNGHENRPEERTA